MAEAAVGFVCAGLIALYGRSTGRDHIERWTLGLVTLGVSAVLRIIAIGGGPFAEIATGLSSVFFVIFALQVGLGAAEFASKRIIRAATHRRVVILGTLAALALVLSTGASELSWAIALGVGGAAALLGGALVLRAQFRGVELGGVMFALLACGGGVAQVVAAVAIARDPRVDLEAPVALGVAAVVLSLVIGVLDAARLSAISQANHAENLAYHDPLTGLPNRALFFDRLNQALAQRERVGNRAAVLFLDLDRFKEINDSLGHAAGDELLRAVSTRILDIIRHSDTLSRFGGDEFTVLLPNIETADDAMRVARKITQSVPRRLLIGGREVFVTCSVGVAVAPEDGCDPDVLVRNADAAMYRAKELGRNTYQLYEPSMNAESLARLDLESRLLKGLAGGEFVMHYQPSIDRQSARVTGVEALIRWQHPDLGLLTPANFIGLAERSGLIHRIGAWGIDRVCRDANRIRASYGDEVVVSINVSAKQVLAADFLEVLEKALRQSSLPGSNLALEINESSAMKDLTPLTQVLERIRTTGVKVIIDDFGSGLSSISTLAQIPHDAFKLDQDLVARIGETGGEDLARAVLNLARTLGKPVTAEGVETESQFSLLLGLGCQGIQGNLVGPPVPLETLLEARADEYKTSRLVKELLNRASYISLERSMPVRDFIASVRVSMN
jgi:diguanylate cyclase (GGDEF)-like protein